MKCPKCQGKVQTIYTAAANDEEIYRQKKCLTCGHTFFTIEFEVAYDEQFKKEWNKAIQKIKKGENR